ncbi:hypothetical protein HY250_03765 [Candidatus Azambacteria bacterium]|nr:hypothetical protein [Candidatus Azambacteria bacterium]
MNDLMRKTLCAIALAFSITTVLIPSFSLAQCPYPTGGAPCSSLGVIDVTTPDITGTRYSGGTEVTPSALAAIVVTLVNWFSWFVGVIAVVMGLYAGFLFITARDNATQLATARKTMLWAIIGVGAAVVTFSIIALTKGILQI